MRVEGGACLLLSAVASFLPGRQGFSFVSRDEVACPESRPGEGVCLAVFWVLLFLFALLCFEGSEGLCDALFGVPGVRT